MKRLFATILLLAPFPSSAVPVGFGSFVPGTITTTTTSTQQVCSQYGYVGYYSQYQCIQYTTTTNNITTTSPQTVSGGFTNSDSAAPKKRNLSILFFGQQSVAYNGTPLPSGSAAPSFSLTAISHAASTFTPSTGKLSEVLDGSFALAAPGSATSLVGAFTNATLIGYLGGKSLTLEANNFGKSTFDLVGGAPLNASSVALNFSLGSGLAKSASGSFATNTLQLLSGDIVIDDGSSPGSARAASVAEPTSLMLASAGLAVIGLRRRQR